MTNELASEATKTTLENSVSWFLADKLSAGVPIASKKFLTNDNLLVYLTRCDVPDSSAPRIKIQVLARVSGGVHETYYQLFFDHRLVRSENNMIFGTAPDASATNDGAVDVSEAEATELIQLVNSLADARPAL
jgi:hypothetical protein